MFKDKNNFILVSNNAFSWILLTELLRVTVAQAFKDDRENSYVAVVRSQKKNITTVACIQSEHLSFTHAGATRPKWRQGYGCVVCGQVTCRMCKPCVSTRYHFQFTQQSDLVEHWFSNKKLLYFSAMVYVSENISPTGAFEDLSGQQLAIDNLVLCFAHSGAAKELIQLGIGQQHVHLGHRILSSGSRRGVVRPWMSRPRSKQWFPAYHLPRVQGHAGSHCRFGMCINAVVLQVFLYFCSIFIGENVQSVFCLGIARQGFG